MRSGNRCFALAPLLACFATGCGSSETAQVSGSGGSGGAADFPLPACNGDVQRSAPTRLTPRGAFPTTPAPPVWTGDRFGVVWNDFRDASTASKGSQVYLQVVDASGKRHGDNVPVSGRGTISAVAAAFGGGRFGVAWLEGESIELAVVDPGTLKPSAPVVLGSTQILNASVRLAWASDRFVVVWNSLPGFQQQGIMLATASADGAVMDAPKQVFSSPGGPAGPGWNLDVIGAGDGYLVVAPSAGGAHVVRVSASGEVRGEQVVDGSAETDWPELHADADGGFSFTWVLDNNKRVREQHIDASGMLVGAPVKLADFGQDTSALSNVATNGNERVFLAGDFGAQPGARWELYRIDPAGHAEHYPFTPAEAALPLVVAGLTWTGREHAAAWQSVSDGLAYDVSLVRLGPCPAGEPDADVACLPSPAPAGKTFSCGDEACQSGAQFCQEDDYTAQIHCRPVAPGCGPSCGFVVETSDEAGCDGWAFQGCQVDPGGNVTMFCSGK